MQHVCGSRAHEEKDPAYAPSLPKQIIRHMRVGKLNERVQRFIQLNDFLVNELLYKLQGSNYGDLREGHVSAEIQFHPQSLEIVQHL